MTTFERGQAQAPQNQNSNNAPHTPENIQHGDRKSLWPKVVTTVGGIALAIGLPYGGIRLYTTNVNNAIEKAGGGDKANSAEPFPGTGVDNNPGRIEAHESVTLDSATPDQFDSDEYFTDEQRTEWANEQLQAPSTDPEYPNMTVEQAAYQRLQAKLASEGRPALGPLVAPSLDNSANEANVLESVAYAAAYYTSDPSRGEKILAAGIDNGHEKIAAMRTHLRGQFSLSDNDRLDTSFKVTFTPNDAAKTQEAGHGIEMASPYSVDRPIGSITPENGTPTRVVYLRDSRDQSEKSEEKQIFTGGRWIAASSIVPSETDRWIPPTNLVDILAK